MAWFTSQLPVLIPQPVWSVPVRQHLLLVLLLLLEDPAGTAFTLNTTSAQSSTTPTSRKSKSFGISLKLGDKQARCDVCGNKVATAGNTTNMIKVLLLT